MLESLFNKDHPNFPSREEIMKQCESYPELALNNKNGSVVFPSEPEEMKAHVKAETAFALAALIWDSKYES